jgi:hypothetical protein
METILNLIWLAITLAAIWLWRFRWTVSRQNPRHSKRMEAVAMVCVLALLFPVISLTDDLHPEILVMDAASGKRNACLLATNAPHVGASTIGSRAHWALGIIPRPSASVGSAVEEILLLSKLNDPVSSARTSRGRAPPSLL